MIFHGLTETRTSPTGNGQQNRQRRFYCMVHGWFDLFVFPDAETKHAGCNKIETAHGIGLQLPKIMKKAA